MIRNELYNRPMIIIKNNVHVLHLLSSHYDMFHNTMGVSGTINIVLYI